MGCPTKRWIGREGNGAEGRLWLNKIMGFFCVCCASNNGENAGMVWAKRRNGLVFCVWVLCLVSGNNSGFAVAGFFCVCCASNNGENAGMVWAKRRNGLGETKEWLGFLCMGPLFGFWQQFSVCCMGCFPRV